MGWKEATSVVMRGSRVVHCPVCGKLLSFFDRTHVRERHPEYFHAARRWQFACVLSLISEAVLTIINSLSADWLVKWFVSGGLVVILVVALVSVLKLLTTAARFRELAERRASLG